MIISGIASLDQIKSYYLRAASIIPGFKERRESTGQWQKEIDDAGQDLPSLL